MGVERVSVDSNFFDDLGADSMVMARFCARVRKRPELPAVSIKDIYQHRTIKSLATALAGDAPVPLEGTFAEVLAEVMGVERVSVDSNFFDDLGADSMVMARFCARVRKRPDLPAVSIKDIYQHPTIKSLATALAGRPACSGRVAGSDLGRGGGSGLGQGGETGEDAAGHPLRGATAPDLSRIWLSRRAAHRSRLRVDFGGLRCARHLPPVAPFRLRNVPLPVHRPDPGEVDPHRSMEATANPHLEPGVPPLLDRQDADPAEPDCAVHGFAAVHVLLADAGREGRARRCDLLHARARLHRPAHHRRWHSHPERLLHQRLSSTRRVHPGGRDHHREERGDQRVDGHRHRDLDGRRDPAGPRLLATRRAGCARRRALARVPGAADRSGLPIGRTH